MAKTIVDITMSLDGYVTAPEAGPEHGLGATCYAFLAAGVVDTLLLHIAPIILGGGTRLFPEGPGPKIRLERESSLSTPDAEHVTYRVFN